MATGKRCSTALASLNLVTDATTAPPVGVPRNSVGSSDKKEDFQFPMTLYTDGAKLCFWAAMQVTFVYTGASPTLLLTLLLANDETPSKSPKATNCHIFLAIANSIHSLCVVYVCVQALSGRIRCCICWGSQAAPEEV